MTAFADLYIVQSLGTLLARGLQLASDLGLPVTTWQTGDPTRTLYYYQAEVLAAREDITAEFVRSAALSSARGAWLKILAKELYGVTPVEATYLTTTVTLTNTKGGYYNIGAGDLTFSSSTSGKTYRNTSTGLFAGPSVVVFDVIADEPGSDSNVLTNEIDTLVTPLVGVVVTSSFAAVAVDEQSEESIREQCRATLGALSPNGPADAYEFVARSPALTGTDEVTKAKSYGSSSTGTVTIAVAGPLGSVSGGAVALVQTAILRWATPLCITPTTVNATEHAVSIEMTYEGDGIPAGFASDAEDVLTALVDATPIAGTITRSQLTSAVDNYARSLGATNVSVVCLFPAADIVLPASNVAVAGTITVRAP